ncbi:MAG TPA: biopolymer transporter ExbD [Flavobacteriaceae bacterium]|nr:biopolymer transporter ExbD [Flavobacteriaceae bacterium]
MARRPAQEVNAGSMADIAFLLLIFFLVTTTIITDQGINRKLPPIQPPVENPPPIKKKNIFIVLINKNEQLLVENEPMEIEDLREAAVKFLDNGGGTGDEACNYCQGPGDPASSDNPTKAIISVQSDRQTEYGTYIAVQNELVAAYNQLRNREAKRLYGMTFDEMEANYKDPTYVGNKEVLKEKITKIQDMFPLKLSEAEPVKN